MFPLCHLWPVKTSSSSLDCSTDGASSKIFSVGLSHIRHHIRPKTPSFVTPFSFPQFARPIGPNLLPHPSSVAFLFYEASQLQLLLQLGAFVAVSLVHGVHVSTPLQPGTGL